MSVLKALPSRRTLAVSVCLLLILGVAAAALHVHISGGPEADRHCPACVAIHSAAPSATVILPLACVASTPLPAEVAVVHRYAEPSSNRFVRPPPNA